jgi:hypothetical protein
MNPKAIFLLDQINNYDKKNGWSEMTIRQFIA